MAEHGRGEGVAEEPLTPPDTRAPSHAERARTLADARSTATLCTLALDPAGYPHGSFVTYAMLGPSPVFLISRLATHTQHLEANARASLLIAEDHAADPLANARVTLLGLCTRVASADTAAARDAFLARHTGASYYVDFSDFAFFRLSVEAIRYIGGYGRMSWVEAPSWAQAEEDPIAPHADGIIRHMNDDHADALCAYARAFTRATDAANAEMTSIDRYGFELSVETPAGRRPARVAFESPIATPKDARAILVAMATQARSRSRKR